MVDATISGMTTAGREQQQLAYDRLSSDEARVPHYLVAMLLAAVPTFDKETPLLSRAKLDPSGSATWSIVATDGRRLVRIQVTGPEPGYSQRFSSPLQAATQNITITPIAGSVTKAEATVKDISGRHDQDIRWQTTWTIHFADGTILTVPTDEQARRLDDRERVDQFVQSFLEFALPH